MAKNRHKASKLRKQILGSRNTWKQIVTKTKRPKLTIEEYMEMEEVLERMFPSNLEELTDALIKELVLQGKPKEYLYEAKEAGLKYNRNSDSLMSEPEIFGSF